jgi:hypothetical protein
MYTMRITIIDTVMKLVMINIYGIHQLSAYEITEGEREFFMKFVKLCNKQVIPSLF